MNTLRTLPLLGGNSSRPSRSSSPAPPTASTTTISASAAPPGSMGPPSLPNLKIGGGSGASGKGSALGPTKSTPVGLNPTPDITSGKIGLTRPSSTPGVPRSRSLSRPLGLALGLTGGSDRASTGGHPRSATVNPSSGSGAGNSPPSSKKGHPRSATLNSTSGGVVAVPNGNGGISPPSSRPPTPSLASARPLPLSLGALPPLTPSAGFVGSGVPTPSGESNAAAAAIGGGFIDAIGLRLNEQVNKVLVGVEWKTKKGVKKGTGWALGEAVVKEFPGREADTYLLRAVLRTAIRSLTIYVSRLEYLILPALTDPTFATPLPLTATAPPLNPAQMFCLTICHAAWETCEVLEVALETRQPPFPRFVQELLRPVMDKLDSLVARVVTPLMGNLKKEMLSAIESGLHSPMISTGKGLPSVSSIGGASTPTLNSSSGLGPSASTTSLVSALPSKDKAISTCPLPVRAFATRVEAAKKVFEVVCKDCKEDGESWIVSVVVALIWKGMIVFGHSGSKAGQGLIAGLLSSSNQQPNHHNGGNGGLGRPPSPEAMAKALAALSTLEPGQHLSLNGGASTPSPSGPVSAVSKMAAILPSRSSSRPPSPPRKSADVHHHSLHLGGHTGGPGAGGLTIGGVHYTHVPGPQDPTVHILGVFETLIGKLVSGLVKPPTTTPPPTPGSSSTDDANAAIEHLAREAFAEALEALQSQKIMLAVLESGAVFISDVLKHLDDDQEMPSEREEKILDALEDVPAILMFHQLGWKVNLALAKLINLVMSSGQGQQSQGQGQASSPPPPPPPAGIYLRPTSEVLGMVGGEAEFERWALSGFGVAEERARRVALAWKSEIERCQPLIVGWIVKAGLGVGGGVNQNQNSNSNSNPNSNPNQVSTPNSDREKKLEEAKKEVRDWLKALGLGLKSRTGVMVLTPGNASAPVNPSSGAVGVVGGGANNTH